MLANGTANGTVLLAGLVVAVLAGLLAYLVPRSWYVPLPLLLLLAFVALTSNDDVYEKVPEDVQAGAYIGLVAVSITVVTGALVGRHRRRRREQERRGGRPQSGGPEAAGR